MTNIPLGRKLCRIISISAFLLLCTTVSAQYGSYDRFAEVLVNTAHNTGNDPVYLPNGNNPSTTVVRNGHGTIDPIISYGSGALELAVDYTPDTDYLGLDTFVVEVRIGAPVILAKIYYVEFVFNVVPSIITTKEDFYRISNTGNFHFLPVDSNDQSTAPQLNVTNIAAAMGGQAIIFSDLLVFKPHTDFSGPAYVTYVVCDSVGRCASEVANIYVEETISDPIDDTVNIVTGITNPVTEFLPISNLTLMQTPNNGSIQMLDGGIGFIYTPGMQSGKDNFIFSDGTNTVEYVIDVLNYQVNSFVFDDYYSSTKGQSLSFNVQDNDRTGNFSIRSHSQPDEGLVVHNGGGNFTYYPDTSFTGLTSFTYEVCAVQNCERATVYITMSNFEPSPKIDVHELTCLRNRNLLINYDVPMADYDFEVIVPATNGIVTIHAGQQSISSGCVTSVGHFMIDYTPDSGFEGWDEFTLSYCNAGYCTDVEVRVEVISIVNYDTCYCQDQCVWPGDMNDDGQISMNDLLCLGQSIGQKGIEREYPNPDIWYGQVGDDWTNPTRSAYMANEKYCDSDGNGVVSIADSISLSNFFGKQHTIIPKSEISVKPYSIGLDHDLTAPPSIGDTVRLYITVGSKANPAFDLSGVAFNISFDPNTVDSSYTKITPVRENWLTREGLPLFMNRNDKVNFDLGLSRIDGAAHHGYGRVFAVDIIIDDTIDGIRRTDDEIPLKIQVSGGEAMDGLGRSFVIPNQELVLMVDPGNQTFEDDQITFDVFPNPVKGDLQLDIDGSVITHLSIYDAQGQLVQQLENTEGGTLNSVSTSALNPGMYMIRIETAEGPQVARFIKSR